MAKKKKPTEPLTYEKEVLHNEESFKRVMKIVRPDIFVLMDLIDTTGVNPYVVFHVIKHLNNLLLGTKYGNVLITVENGVVTFVRGEEATKLNENLKKVNYRPNQS